jgi:hypothetical protein
MSAAAFALALSAGPVQAQTAPPPQEEVVVEGHHLEEALRAFVGEVSAAPTGEDRLARWDRRICASVAGIRARYGQFIVDRLAQRAFQVGLESGEAGCQPNVLILVTPDSNVLAQTLVDNYKGLLAYYHDDQNTRGRAAIEDFASTARPVRWWHVANTTSADGGRVRNSISLHTMAGGGLSGGTGAVMRVPGTGASRLHATTRQDFDHVVVIVDATQAQGLQFEALADYIAMVALAQLDPAADVSAYSSILNLFASRAAGAAAPMAMTEWDVAYLQGLYGATRNATSARAQEHQIARQMNESVTAPTP